MSDYTVGDTLYFAFTTRQFSDGAPTTLAGTPAVSAYEDASLTQITAGITLGVDHDSVTGLNMITVVATGANGFESGKDYNLVITAGTVGGTSVVGEVVGRFTLGRSAAAVDLANGTDGLGALKTTADAIETDTQDIQGRLPAALVGGKMDSDATAISGDTVAADNLELDYDGTGYNKANSTIGTTTTNTDMRGTDNAALASVLGALTDAAAAGDPTTADTVMQYVKQLINVLVGTTGVATFPAAAAPANNVSLAEIIRAIYDDTNELQADDYPTTIAAIQADTDDIQTRLPAALVGGRMDSDIGAKTGNVALSAQEKADVNAEVDNALDTAIPASPTAASINEGVKRLARSVGVVQEFTIDNTSFTATTTAAQVDTVDIDALEATDDHYIGRVIVFTSGALKHQATDITDYDGTNKRFAYTALTEAPADNDTFIVV